MSIILRCSLILAILLFFAFLMHMVKKKSLNIRYILLWLFVGLMMLVVVIFPQGLAFIISLLGVIEFTNGVFALMLFFLIILLISLSSVVSKLNDQLRQLTQRCAMYEKRIRDLEEKVKEE